MTTHARSHTMSPRAVERTTVRAGDGCLLAVASFPAHGSEERGILLIPPLIGASYILFGRQFGYLTKRGYRIVSLNYRGHEPSGGKFALQTSFSDTLMLTRHLRDDHPDSLITAVGTCSGSLPIFHILSEAPDLLDRLVFINAIYHIQQTARPLQAVRYYLRSRGLSVPSGLGDMASVVLDEVFPEIRKDAHHFGILRYDRVNRLTITREYLMRGGPNTNFVSKVPTLCCYALKDRMLGLVNPALENEYKRAFLRRFQSIAFETFDGDHFMSGLREQVAERVYAFLQSDA